MDARDVAILLEDEKRGERIRPGRIPVEPPLPEFQSLRIRSASHRAVQQSRNGRMVCRSGGTDYRFCLGHEIKLSLRDIRLVFPASVRGISSINMIFFGILYISSRLLQ